MVADCPKFIPNIFNNAKCSSCFKTREEHGDVALDSKNSRKVVKCGYLFIAPRDWDFCNPAVYRAKRWQRRWFVLWSDDQLTWSIDDQPDTIPQGTLDMREILEVKSAEEVTEHPYSLALTGKQTTFIKGMNNEDIKAWQSVLMKYGNRLITVGGKRSLTLPGGFGGGGSSNIMTSPRFETGVVIGPSRPRFHSVASTTPGVIPMSSPSPPFGGKSSTLIFPGDPDHEHEDHGHEDEHDDEAFTPIPKVPPTSPPPKGSSSALFLLSDLGSGEGRRSPAPPTVVSVTPKSRQIYVALANVPKGKGFRSFVGPPQNRLLSSTILPPPSNQIASPSEDEAVLPSSQNEECDKCFEPAGVGVDVTDCPCPTTVRALRGDPDGCGGLDNLDGGPLRKGWLLRQTDNNEWTKHWFVLQNNSFLYYENSEELSPLGQIEIREDSVIRQFESNRHYGFEVYNPDQGQSHKLSAITNGMRGIWMKALESARSQKPLRSPEESSPTIGNPNPPSPPLKSKKARFRRKTDLKLFESLKDEFSERERELESIRTELRVDSPRMRELLKSQALQIDSFRTQIASGFMEIEKLEHFCKSRETEFQEQVKGKDKEILEIREELKKEEELREKLVQQGRILESQTSLLARELKELRRLLKETEEEADLEGLRCKELESLMEQRNQQMLQEMGLLRTRCNDLTEKLYQSERTARSLKNKLGRVKSQSLKDRQIESDVLHKICDLEEKISKLDQSSSPLSPSSITSIASPVPPSPGPGGSGGIVNVIMKLNDLDQRVDKAVDSFWFRRGELGEEFVGCGNCRLLEMELQEREERLEVLEENLVHLEADFNDKVKELKEFVKAEQGGGSGGGDGSASAQQAQSVTKYQVEIEQLRNLCAKGLEAMENSHRRMVLELEEKHRRELQTLKMEKENELAEETKATLSALDAMRKNHQFELQREMAKFKEEFMSKFRTGQDLSDLHKEHEKELTEVKEEILRLSEKYSLKCVEASKLEETISYLKTQLNEAKRRILDLEGSEVQSIISCASASSKAAQSMRPKPKPRTSLKREEPRAPASHPEGPDIP